ncbi:hypothetical protein NP233_g2327 [Leucocoprinus birnbaumii]|uniref:DUF985 domain-containing protein n=1 Tax=Leucocoprinus birnbaumii TaxID=56174 RepID=A0AAD5YZ50_9AGAR|nr:hypothetical protein NP233_g2327 [Leucocoprinus birnbaumii]
MNSSEIIASLGLREHPLEGGYFIETDRRPEEIASPFTTGEFDLLTMLPVMSELISLDKVLRPLATSIHYLLTYDQPNGAIHSNKSVTYHVLHQGRAEYTMIIPETPPKVEKKIMGNNISAGETRLLIVGSGVWKMSKLMDEELSYARTDEDKGKVNCLITEVVIPGFTWEDHHIVTEVELANLFDRDEQEIKQLRAYIK